MPDTPQTPIEINPEEMRRLGLFARQVGHDFNNFLSSILGYASLLRSKLGVDDPRHRYAVMVETAGTEAGETAERLLFFGRLWTLPPSKIPVDLAPLQDQIVRTLEGGQGSPEAEVEAERIEAPGRVLVDLRALQRAMVALATNACEAQAGEETPRLRVRFRLVAMDALPRPPAAHAPSGQWLAITISDPGCGMDPETLAQAPLPGFTTRPGARRQGLGLPIAVGFAHVHGGMLAIESTPGHGTVVTIWLPVAETS